MAEGGWHRCLLLTLSASSVVACGESEMPDDAIDPPLGIEVGRVTSAPDALVGLHLPTLDPSTMERAEIRLVLDGSSICEFRYVSDGKPVLAFHAAQAPEGGDPALRGVLNLSGALVPLSGKRSNGSVVLTAGEIRATVTAVGPEDDLRQGASKREANLLFEVGKRLKVGYQGYYSCVPRETAQHVAG